MVEEAATGYSGGGKMDELVGRAGVGSSLKEEEVGEKALFPPHLLEGGGVGGRKSDGGGEGKELSGGKRAVVEGNNAGEKGESKRRAGSRGNTSKTPSPKRKKMESEG